MYATVRDLIKLINIECDFQAKASHVVSTVLKTTDDDLYADMSWTTKQNL